MSLGWRTAFLRQARSDFERFEAMLGDPSVPRCHLVHYLQMLTEKLAKGFSTTETERPPAIHRIFVRFLQLEMHSPSLYHFSDLKKRSQYKSSVASLLPLAHKIEALAPQQAGILAPNPEYPWQQGTAGPVVAPADYSFDEIISLKQFLNLYQFLKRIFTALES